MIFSKSVSRLREVAQNIVVSSAERNMFWREQRLEEQLEERNKILSNLRQETEKLIGENNQLKKKNSQV